VEESLPVNWAQAGKFAGICELLPITDTFMLMLRMASTQSAASV
jgi:hypothetical protein